MTQKKNNTATQVSRYCKMLLLAILLCFMSKAVNAQFGNFIQVNGNVLTADTCKRNTGSFELSSFSSSGFPVSADVTNSLGTLISSSSSNSNLYENLPEDIYTITPLVINFGDVAVPTQVIISGYSTIVLNNYTLTQPSCFASGSINLNITGAMPLTYVWSNGSTTNPVVVNYGNYILSFTVTASDGCTLTDGFSITTPNTASALLNGCGSYTLNGNTYTQSTTINETINNNGCIVNKTTYINISNPNAHQLTASKNSLSCSDSSILTVVGTNKNLIQNINWFRNGVSIDNVAQNNLLITAGGNGSGNALNQLSTGPRGITFDADGNMYVADFSNSRVLKYPPNSTSATNGVVVAGGNGPGTALNQLSWPTGLCIQGNFLYVGDQNNGRVMKYPINPSNSNGLGTVAAQYGLSGSDITGVFVTPNGELYVSELLYGRVVKFPPNSDQNTIGLVVAGSTAGSNANIGFSGHTHGSALNQLDGASGIWVTANGDLYVTEFYNNRVTKWSPGATTGVIVAGGNGLNQLWGPSDITFDGAGNMYVTSGVNGKVLMFTPNSNINTVGTVIANSVSQYLNCIALDNNEKLFFTDGSMSRIVFVDKNLSKTVYQSGSYTAEITLYNGCTVTVGPINITRNIATATRDTFNEAGCETYSWNDIVYTSSTTVFDTIKYVGTNCDSVYRVVNITIYPKTYSTTNVQLCPNQFPYSWNGGNYTTIGTYNVTLPMANTNGCDSIATLNITATNNCCVTTYSTTNESFCFTKNPFNWNGSNYYTSGTYTVKLVNANGCDSLATLNLVVGTPTSSTTTEIACDSYTWNGNTYTTSGTYNFNTTNSSGCDSTATLFLTINASPVVTLSTTNSPCDNPKTLSLTGVPAGATVQWLLNNQTYNTTGISNTGISTLASGLNGPVHIAKDAADNIYVADYNNDRIIKIAATTNTVTVVAGGNGRGNAANQLNQPSGVSLDGNDLIIADHWNHRIVRWTIGAVSGVTVAGNGFANATAHQLAFPLNAIVDASGNLYVADRNNHRIQKFAPGATNGVTVAGGNGQGTALNQLNLPNDIDLDINGDLIISDRLNARILRWKLGDANGTIEAATGLSQPLAVYIAPNGTKYVTDVTNNTVTRWNVGATTASVVVGNAQTPLNYPAGVTIANDGCVVVSQYNNNSVKKYCGATNSISTTTAGTYTATITANGCSTTAVPLVITMPSVEERNNNIKGCGQVVFNNITYTSNTFVDVVVKDKNGCDSVLIHNNIEVKDWEYTNQTIIINGCGSVIHDGVVYTTTTVLYDTLDGDLTKCQKITREININVTPWSNINEIINIDSCGRAQFRGIVYNQSTVLQWSVVDSLNCTKFDTTVNINITPWIIEEETTTYTGCGSVRVGDIVYTSDTTLYDTIIKPTGCVKNVYITIIDVRAYQYNVTTTNLVGCGSVLHNGITYTNSTILSDTTDVSIDTLCKKNVNTVNITVTPWTYINDTTRLNGCGSVIYKGTTYTASTILSSASENIANCTRTNTVVIITVTPWVVYNDTTRLNGCDSVIFNTVIYRNNDTIRTTNVREDSCLTRNRVVIITVNPSPVFTLTNTSGICDRPQNIAVNVNGGTNGQTITWTRNGTTFNPTVINGISATTVAGGNGSGSNANQFNSCLGLLLDAQGRIYVGDYLNHRVQRFPANSTTATNGITYAGGNGLGVNLNQFERPAGMCFDAAGNLYVADYYNARVLRFPPNSTSTTQGVIVAQENLGYVNDVFVDDLNRIYVVDHLSDRVTRFPANSDENTTGVVVAGLSSGNTANNLNNPVSVFVDANYNVIVADKHNHRIVSYPSNYTTTQTTAVPVLAGTGTAGSGVTQLNMPVDVMFDPQGRMYVTEEAGNRIIRFPANSTSGAAGTVVYGNNGTTLSAPYHMAQDALGRIYIAEGGNFRVIRLDSTQTVQVNQTGTCTVTVTNQFGCSSTKTINVTIPPVLVRDTARLTGCGKVTNPVTNTGYTTSSILRDTTRTANGCDSSIKVTIITVTPWNIINDTIRVSGCSSVLYNNITYTHNDTLRTSIVKIDSCLQRNTTIIITVNQPPVIDIVNTSNACDSVQTLNINGVPNSAKIKWYKDGNFINDDELDNSYTPNGYNPNTSVFGNACQATLYGGFGYTGNYVALDTGGKVYLTQLCTSVGGESKIIINNTDYLEGIIQGQTFNKLGDARGICFDKQNNLYVADNTNKCVVKYLAGATRNSMGTVICKANIANINDVFVDDLGRIYVCDSSSKAVYRYPVNSNQFTLPTIVAGGGVSNGSLIKELIRPTGITVDENYNVIVVQNCNNAFGNFKPTSNRVLLFPNNYTINNNISAQVLLTDNGFENTNFFDAELDVDRNLFVVFYNNNIYGEGGFLKFKNYGSPINKTYLNSNFRKIVGGSYPYIPNIAIDKNATNIYIGSLQWANVLKYTKTNKSIFINQSGTYTATVTDTNGCTATDTIVVTIPPVVVRDTNNVVTGCGSVIRNGVTYTTNTVIATDTLTTLVNHCDSVIHYTRIIVNQSPIVSLQNITSKPCSNPQKIKVVSSASTVTVVWQMGGNTIASGLNVTELTVTQSGTYTAIVTDANGCTATTNAINVSVIYPTARAVSIIACNSYTNKGVVYTKDVKLKDTLRSVNGCDSVLIETSVIISKNLTPSLSILVRGSDRVCKGSNLSIKAFPVNGGTNPQYQWTVNGVPVAGATGVYFISNSLNNGDTVRCILTSNYPCLANNNVASAYIIARVTAPTFKQVNISGCNSVILNNITYQNSTVVSDTVRNNIGCDSIITTTNITINKLTAETRTNNIVGCNSVVYNGVTYINSTTLKDTLRSTQGCDSLYRINNIIVIKVVAITNITNLSGCGKVIFKERTYTNSTVINDTIRTAQGCDSVYNINNIIVNPTVTPTIVITPSQNPVCSNVNVIYSSTITNGGTNPQYQWYKNGVLIPGATSATYSNAGLPDSTIVYTCTLTSNAPCAEPRTVVSNGVRLTFGGVAIASIAITANQTTICSTATVIFTTIATNGGTNPQYQWKKNGVNISGANSASYSTATITNNDVFTCVLTSNSPCVSTTNVVSNGIAITVNASSVTDIYNDGSIIAPAYIPLYIPTTVSTTQAVGGVWKISNRVLLSNSPATTVNITLSSILPGANSLIYQLTNQATKCTTNYIKSLIIISSSTPPVTQNITLCSLGSTRTLTSSYSSVGTWVSSDLSVVSLVSTSSTATTSSVLIKSNTAGTATIQYNVQLAPGVFYTASTIVTVAPVTIAPIIGNSSICVGATTQLTNATPSGVWSSIVGRASVNTNGLITAVSAGVAEIRYTVNNAAGCSAYAVKNVTVNAIPLAPTITYAPTTLNPQLGAGTGQFCLNRTFDVVGSPLGGTWTSSNTNIMTVTNLGTINTVGLGSGSLNYRITTNGCSSSRTITGNVVTCAARGVSMNDKLQTINDFSIYPNPAKSFISLSVKTLIGAGSIVITDLYGKQVKTQSLSMGTNTIDISSFAKGMYFVSTITSEGKTTKKLVVE